MRFPLTITQKIFDISPQFYVREPNGELVMYVKQKLLALREKVNIYSSERMDRVVIHMRADRMLDFNANYLIETGDGARLGSLRRQGMRSLWKASYELHEQNASGILTLVGNITETNPWVKVVDGLIGQIPNIGLLTNWFLHPKYSLLDEHSQELATFTKKPSFFERRFEIDTQQSLTEPEQQLLAAAGMMLCILEGDRG